MKHYSLRVLIIACIPFLFGSLANYSVNLEAWLGLNTLFRIRGPQTPPAEVLVVALDEASENNLGVGQDITRWRVFHSQLIQRLKQQGALLVVFDLQFILPHPAEDKALAAAMQSAGNVLIAECVQKFRRGVEDFYGREECSDSNKQPMISREGDAHTALAEQLVAMRKVSPTPLLAAAALDRAPFFLIYDNDTDSIYESWTFFDDLAEVPSLPLLSWFYYLQDSGALPKTNRPLSQWLTEQRRACANAAGPVSDASRFAEQINNLLCQGDSRYLNFYGPPQTLRMESYSDVYQGKVQDLQGKVVFVGRANRQFSPGKTDFFQTPYSTSRTGKTAGVEIMATQFANLLQDRFIQITAPHWLIAAGYGVLIALLFVGLSGWHGMLSGMLLSLVYAVSALWWFGQRQWWLPVAAPLLVQLPLAWLLSLAWSRYDLMRERNRLLAFVHRVFPQWVTVLPTAPGQWSETTDLPMAKSERDVKGLCLATDIAGYTTIAAQHTPREMSELLNAYYQVLGHPVISHMGVIADVTGDAMMAVWFDLPEARQRRAACLAALEMEAAVGVFNQNSSLEPLTTRIGLHEGELSLGSLNTGTTSHYRAIGDTVNTASRIEGVNKILGTRILASELVADDLTDICSRPVGSFRLVGKTQALELLEIVGVASSISPMQAAIHQEFTLGLDACRQGRWQDAIQTFEALMINAPDDGPTRFYLELAKTHRQNPALEWDGVVTLEMK